MAVFQSPCVTVLRQASEDYELAYEVLLWDSCSCEECPCLPAALSCIGPWAAEALPLDTTYDAERECTVLEVAAYAALVGPAPGVPTHLIPRQRTPEPEPPIPPPSPDRGGGLGLLSRAATVLVFAALFMVATVTGKQVVTPSSAVHAGEVLGSAWIETASDYGLTCTSSGLTGTCVDPLDRTWMVTAFTGPYGSRRYELCHEDTRMVLSVFGDRDRYERRLRAAEGRKGFYALTTPMGPAILNAPDISPAGEAAVLSKGGRKL